ncbi:hypothetical protein RDV64_02655 [Acuticoccus sp. MNP-M23]|uniref:class I SAM-dependent RNA methyltransferase n=1 Tax=Acuticoccus sp. MNP-M23 TaxID=3072793 RepID=UPI002815D88F|nr:hypothetical protein [Acuticoccus sp. MNP-M23]WMS43322.1 hypothetical protein RDV64_02655 [Acuticoccus sp. MNP-M23]
MADSSTGDMNEPGNASAPADQAVVGLDDAGDGILEHGGRPVPLAIPGDRVRRGEGTAVIEPLSANRAEPPCPLFGVCGGCRLQHLGDALYAEWKRGRLLTAMERQGLAAPVAPMVRSPLASRRRLTLTAKGGKVGYFARGTHDIIDVPDCPALAPALNAALPALRDIARTAAGQRGEARLVATLCANGIDVALAAPKAPKPQRARKGRKPRVLQPLRILADDPAIVRVLEGDEILFARETPHVLFGGVPVELPPAAFLQATLEGERALTEAVLAGVGDAPRVFDAFCGLGTFTLPLARRASVLAVDGDPPAIAALDAAVRQVSGAKPITVKRRDLMRDPLNPVELNAFDAVVFDPPRAGAKALADALAASDVPRIVAVSCEPSTLARDCAILTAAGYRIETITPVDQFVATAHLEAVAVLRRD